MIKNSMFKKILLVVCICFILAQPVWVIFSQSNKLFYSDYKNQYNDYKKAYYSSQYMIKKNPGIIPDETLESFAGGFVYYGNNPILIIHDQPPLGRYLVALSIFLFNNQFIIPLVLLLLSVLGIFLLSKLVLKNVFVSLIPVAIFMNEPLFITKLLYIPLLEPIQLPFIIYGIYFFIRGILVKNSLKWFILASVMLGGVISTRYFILGAVLAATWIFYLIFLAKDRKKLLLFVLTLPLAGVVLLLSYTQTMLHGYSPIKIIGIQKYIFMYHRSKFILPFTVWDLLFFNRWHTWWGSRAVIPDTNWILLWPISAILTGCSLLFSFVKRYQYTEAEKIIALWLLAYGAMLSVGITSTRYFLPFIPFFYILACSFVVKVITSYIKNR